MTITEKPSSLSLSQNLNRFVINTVHPINFILKKGEDVLMSQRYVSSENGLIEIDVKDIIHASLRYQLRESGEVYEQTELAADFTAVIDDTEEHFRVVRGGVANLEDTAATFLKQNWLTWQPAEKKVTYYSPEFLTYYAVEDCAIKLKAYFSESDNETITYASLSAGKAYTLPLQYAHVAGKLNNRLPGAYDVWVESTAGNRLTYIQRYRAEAAKNMHEDWVLFENSLGGIDCFRAYGEKSLDAKHTHNLAELDEETEEYRIDTERVYTKSTGYLNKEEANWLLDFFPSTKKYIYAGNTIRRITVSESEAKIEKAYQPCSYSFSYAYADAVSLLNLERSEPAEILDIEIPELGNFTIPPRLAEVGRISLSEGVLFPVQHPYSETWGTTTVGAISKIIGTLLGQQAGTGGGVGHQHENIDLLNLIELLGDYLLVNKKKISAGYADKAGSVEGLDEKYLRKDKPDQTEHLLKMLAGAEIGDAHDSMTGGKGTILDDNGRIQTDRLEVRQSMTVQELIFNRRTAMEGDYDFTDSGLIDRVEKQEDGTIDLYLRKRWDMDFTSLHENDIIYGMVRDLSSDNAAYYTSWMRILHVDTTANKVNVNLYQDADVPGGKNYEPAPLMSIIHRGNPVDTDRQSYWYVSSTEKCICMLDGVTKPILEESNYSIIIGRLKHLSIFDNLPVNYLQSYVYCRGIALQDMFRIDYQGVIARAENQRGKWDAQTAISKPYQSTDSLFDSVYHYGCKWMCLKTGTTQEPQYGCTDWAMIEGNPYFTIDIKATDDNWLFDAEKFDTTLSITGELYNQDVTDHILDSDVTWKRDTGNITEDNAWNAAHTDIGKNIHLTTHDLGPDYLSLTGCKFIATALLRDGVNTLSDDYIINI